MDKRNMFQIQNQMGDLLLSVDSDSLCFADLQGAKLTGANLRWVNLEGAKR